MPTPTRTGLKFACRGVNLNAPIDSMPPGDYPYLNNVHSIQEGVLEARPGQTPINSSSLGGAHGNVHSAIAVQNLFVDGGQSIIATGANTGLYAVTFAGNSLVDTGYSGNPLTMVRFRPDQSTDPWVYIGNNNKMSKLSAAGVVRNIGISPPTQPLYYADAYTAAKTDINDFSYTTGWVASGNAGSITTTTRTNSGHPSTIGYIVYDTFNNPDYCTIAPTNDLSEYSWVGNGTIITLGGSYVTHITQVTSAINDTTITGIVYDTGSVGFCTLVLAVGTQGLDRNTMLVLDNGGGLTEPLRVLSVSFASDGSVSVRCSTTNTWTVGTIVHGKVSFRCLAADGFTAGVTITATCLGVLMTGTGDGKIHVGLTANLSKMLPGPRVVQPDDYIHLSIQASDPLNITYGRMYLDVDSTTNDFTRNYYIKEFRPSDFQVQGNSTLTQAANAITNELLTSATVPYATSDVFTTNGQDTAGQNAIGNPQSIQMQTGVYQWSELFFKVSDLQRVGTDFAQTLANVKAIQFEFETTGDCQVYLSSWWVGGGYGPDTGLGAPVGMKFRYRYRDSTTGAKSIPSPAIQYDVFPLRQGVLLAAVSSSDPQVDTLDYEVFDPNLQVTGQPAVWTYIGSQPQSQIATGFHYFQSSQDIALNPPLETNTFKPFPTLQPPLNGTVNVCGTRVTRTTGNTFPATLIPGTLLTINGIAYQTYGSPIDANTLVITQSAGVLAGALFQISSPVVYGTPLPVLFGPLQGSTAPVIFGLGDPDNPGFLYWLNPNDPDSADAANYIEITDPSEPLLDGCVWNGYVFVASANKLFLCTPTVGATNISFTPIQIPTPTGLWRRYCMVAGIDGVYFVGRDGIYKATPYAGASLISRDLWPLFPHEGQQPGGNYNGYFPIFMANLMRLTAADSDIYFDYIDDIGVNHTWRHNPTSTTPGWWHYTYAHPAQFHYWGEGQYQGLLFQGTNDGNLMYQGALLDEIAPISCTVQTPCLNQNDSRSQKLYVQVVTDLIGTAVLSLFFNYNEITGPISVISGVSRSFQESEIDLGTTLALYQNITGQYTFSPGTKLYEFQPAYYSQPYTTNNYTTQFLNLNQPGWKILKYARLEAIGASPIVLTITSQDAGSRTYALNVAPSTNLASFDTYLDSTLKGRMYNFSLSSSTPFVPFGLFIRMKHWGGVEFEEVNIMGNNI